MSIDRCKILNCYKYAKSTFNIPSWKRKAIGNLFSFI